MSTDIENQIAKLEAEREQLQARQKRRRKAQAEDEKRESETHFAIRRLRLKSLLGVADAVKLACRFPSGHRCAYLNDALGTLKSVRRTRADVLFNVDNGDWGFPLDDLMPADGAQGWRMY